MTPGNRNNLSPQPTSTRPESPAASLKNIFFSLALGTLGGALFYWLGLPLPWMLGAMAVTAAAAIHGQPIVMSRHLRQVMIAVIGVLLGSAFSPDMLGQIARWAASLTLLATFLVLLALLVPWLLRKAGYDYITAYFAALPAGLTEMTTVGMDKGGNPQIIALTHTVRVLLVAFGVPFIMVLLAGYEPQNAPADATAPLAAGDVTMLVGCGVLGLWLGRCLNIPAGALAGPLALSAAIHLSGLTASAPPAFLVSVAQVVLGTAVGARFAGLTLRTSSRTLVVATGVTMLMLVLSVMSALLLGPLINVPPLALLLALAPGGVTEMSLIALAMNQDIAFVTTHHIVRIALVIMIGPAVFATVRRWRRMT